MCRRAPVWIAAAVVLLLTPGTANAQDASRGARLYREMECSGCHGDAATGGMGPALAHTSLGLQEVLAQLRNPRGMMPTFDPEQLSEADAADIYAWVQSLDPPTLADKDTWWSIDLLNLPTPATSRRGDFEVHFSHRFSEPVQDAGLERLYGLDSFAFPGFWFSYGLTDRIAPYFGRTANLATWEFGVKVGLLREGDLGGAPVSVAAQIGGTALDADGIANATRFTAEVPVGVRIGDRLAVQAVPIYVTNPGEIEALESESWSLALGLGASIRLSRTLSFDGEWITNVDGFERPGGIDQWQAGVTMHVGRHLFQILLTNSVQTTPDFMAPGTLPTGIDSDVRLGFNLIRLFAF